MTVNFDLGIQTFLSDPDSDGDFSESRTSSTFFLALHLTYHTCSHFHLENDLLLSKNHKTHHM